MTSPRSGPYVTSPTPLASRVERSANTNPANLTFTLLGPGKVFFSSLLVHHCFNIASESIRNICDIDTCNKGCSQNLGANRVSASSTCGNVEGCLLGSHKFNTCTTTKASRRRKDQVLQGQYLHIYPLMMVNFLDPMEISPHLHREYLHALRPNFFCFV